MPCDNRKIPYTEEPARKSDTRRPDGTFHRKLRDITSLKKEDLWLPKEAGDFMDLLDTGTRKAQSGIKKVNDYVTSADLPFDAMQSPELTEKSTVPNLDRPWISNARKHNYLKSIYSPLEQDTAAGTWGYKDTPAWATAEPEVTRTYGALPPAQQKAFMDTQLKAGYQWDDTSKGFTKTHAAPTFNQYGQALLSTDPSKTKDFGAYEAAAADAGMAAYKQLPFLEQLRGGGALFNNTMKMANQTAAFADALEAKGDKKGAQMWRARAAILEKGATKGRETVDAKLRGMRKPIAWGVGLAVAGIGITALLKKMFGNPRQNISVNVNQGQPQPWTVQGYNGPQMGGR